MVEEAAYHSVTAWLNACRQPLLVSHRRADGDALGALAALALALRRRGADPSVALFEPFPRHYALIEPVVAWRLWERDGKQLTACDALIVLDTCALAQLEPLAPFLPAAPRTLVIDHHATRDAVGTRPGDLGLIDESASATCLIVAEWIRAAGVRLDRDLALPLFVGVATDCGWFQFSNTDARTLRVVANLLDAGIAVDALYQALYQQDPPAKLRLIARMLQSLTMHADGRLAVMTLRPADFAAAGADHAMTENLVNEANRLGCVVAAILCVEEPDGIVRINFRSKQTVDVSRLAARFGGGGHPRAAGARVHGAWDDVVARVTAAAISELEVKS